MNTNKSINLRRLIAGATVAVMFAGFAATSQPDAADSPQLIVKYGDLNSSSPEGATALYSRVRAAAKAVCRGLENRDLAFKTPYDACIDKAVADAVTKVGQPTLTALHNAKAGIPKQVVLASSQTR